MRALDAQQAYPRRRLSECAREMRPVRSGMVAASYVSWPGLARPPTTSQQPILQIVPIRIASDDQSDRPSSRPPLNIGLALDRAKHIAVLFGVNQALQVVARCKHRSSAVLMRRNPCGQVTRDAGVQRPIRTIGHDVEPSRGHRAENKEDWSRKGLRNADYSRSSVDQRRKVVGGRAKHRHVTTFNVGALPRAFK
jgi:hypothetical protein